MKPLRQIMDNAVEQCIIGIEDVLQDHYGTPAVERKRIREEWYKVFRERAQSLEGLESYMEDLKAQGMTDAEIAAMMGHQIQMALRRKR